MADYSGYFLQGLAGGISQGMEWGQNILDIRERKKAKDDAIKLKDKLLQQGNTFTKMINDYGPEYSDEEALSLQTYSLGCIAEIQDRFKPVLDNIKAGRTEQAKEQIKQIDEYANYLFTLDLTPGQVEKSINNFMDSGLITSEKALNYFKAKENILKRKTEAREMQPAETKEPTISDYGTGLKYLTNIAKISPENWETARKGLESKFGFDYSGITQESLKETEMGDEVFNLYNTPEEVMTNVKPSAGLTVMPKRDTKTGKYYASFSKETITEPTPPKPETVTTLKNWEKIFDIKSEEGPKTEEEYNRALDLLAQSEDVYKPIYTSWKEALISEVKGIGKELKGITDRTDRKTLLDVYKRKLGEIKAKYPEVDLKQFSRPKEMSGWDKFMEWVGF